MVVAHGFTGALDRPAVRRAARALAWHAMVITFSFRGHGRSGGRSTLGDREVLDLAAAVRWARSLGHTRVATVGFSMGGSVVLRHAALYGPHGLGRAAADGPGRTTDGLGPGSDGPGAGADGAGRTAGSPGPTTDSLGPGSDSPGPAAAAGPGGLLREPLDEPPNEPLDGPLDGLPHGPLHGPLNGPLNGPRHGPMSESLNGRLNGPLNGLPDAGRTDAHADAVVSVSAPARWYYRGTAPMRRLHWVVTRPAGRLVGRLGLRTRIHPEDWNPEPLSPVGAVPYIAPVPLLIVHGDQDPYFPLDHPRSLAGAANGAAELWIEPGLGHAENAADDALLARIGDWTQRARPVPEGG
ncbi:alpha/beta hydrolase [Streptomyces sp. NPDC002055]|uniref:alpha/beta hydrolase n=1 Tax=Streptomyces sp. NPDC002055 TaxID=3154534 RepID=UPI00332BA7CE